MAIALLAAGCARNTGGCGIGNGCAGGSASTWDADAGVTTTAATLALGSNAGSGSAPTTTADPAPGLSDPGATVTEQGRANEVRIYVPAPSAGPPAAPSTTSGAAAATAQGDQGASPTSPAIATPAVTAPPVTTSSQPQLVTYADAGASSPRATPSTSSPPPPTIEQWSTYGAFYGPQGYALSEAGAGPFSNGAGGSTGFPSD